MAWKQGEEGRMPAASACGAGRAMGRAMGRARGAAAAAGSGNRQSHRRG